MRTPLFKVTSLNSLSVLLKIGTGIIVSKFLAIFVGTEGMALTGNLRNFMTSVESISTLGVQNGILKKIVENKNDDSEIKKIISTVFITLIVIVLVLSIVLFSASYYLNDLIFGSNYAYSSIFKVLALALPWYVATLFLIIIINGFGRFKKVIYINIIGNIIGLIFSLLVIWQYHTFGALLSIIISPSLLFFVAYYYINKEINLLKNISIDSFDFENIKSLSPYIMMTLVSSVFGPMVYLSIRNVIIGNLGIEQAGFWEATTRISSYYFMFISSVISLYFLPKLVFASNSKSTRNVFVSYFNGIMPIFILGLFFIYFLRFFIIQLLFTEEFIPMERLFFWQLLGDVFKAFSMILGYQLLAKKLTIAFIVSELFSLLIMFLMSMYFITIFDIEGVVISHAITYFVYLLLLVMYFRKIIFLKH
jgi:PST family polysaccharide transporter